MSEQKNKGIRLTELDALRGLAAIAVVLCHYTSICHRLDVLDFSFTWGSFGPHLFFLISGFVIFMSLGRSKSSVDFVFSRFSRLFPVYWLGVIISTVMVLCFISGRTVSPTEFFGNLTMCQTWLRIPDIEVSYWTLGVELKFYAIALVYFLVQRRIGIEAFAGLWVLAIVSFRLLDAAIGLPHVLATPLIVDYGHLFIAGIMMYQLKFTGWSWSRHALIAVAVPLQFLSEGLESTFIVSTFLATFYLFVAGKLSFIAVRPLVYLGGISYSLYLIHGIMGHAIIINLSEYTSSAAVLMLVPIVASLAIAHVITNRWEVPTLKFLRSWYKRYREVLHGRARPILQTAFHRQHH